MSATRTVTTFDIELLREAVFWAEEESTKPAPECGWFQNYYAITEVPDDYGQEVVDIEPQVNGCGTAFCEAGYIAFSRGYTQPLKPTMLDEEKVCELLGYEPDYDSDYLQSSWEDVARKLLGITIPEGDRLFDGNNNIQDVRDAAEDIARAHGESL